MSTQLQEKVKVLNQMLGDHDALIKKGIAAPDEERPKFMEEVQKSEADLANFRKAVTDLQELEGMARRTQEETEKLKGTKGFNFGAAPGDRDAEKDEPRALKSFGDVVVDEYAEVLDKFRSRHSGVNWGIEMPYKNVAHWKMVNAAAADRALKTTLTTSGLTNNIEFVPGVIELGQQVPHVRDLLAKGETTAPVIRYLRENSFTNAADAVAEGNAKPEAAFDLVPANSNVEKIAVVARVTDEMFADYPQVRSYINTRLPFMVELKEDSELLNGSGSGAHLTGINTATGTLSGGNLIQTAGPGVDPLLNTILRGITKIEAESHYVADGIVMNTFDWEEAMEYRAGTGDAAGGVTRGPYLLGNPFYGPFNKTLWGLPVVTTITQTRGIVTIGAWKIGAMLFQREGLSMAMTNSDASDFQYNRVAIRVEIREALAIYSPQAFAKVQLQSHGLTSSSA